MTDEHDDNVVLKCRHLLDQIDGSIVDGMAPKDKVRFLQSNPEVAQHFMDTTSFKQKTLPGVRALVFGDEQGKAAMADAEQKIGPMTVRSNPKNEAAFREYVAALRADGSLPGVLNESDIQSKINTQSKLESDPIAALIAESHQIRADTLSSVNIPGLIPDAVVESAASFWGNTAWKAEQAMGTNTQYVENLASNGRLSSDDRQYVQEQLELLRNLNDQLEQLRTEQAAQSQDHVNAVQNGNQNGNQSLSDPANLLNQRSR